ncbi:tyrosine-type recombinase/integrase [Eubacterium multiforme]|nr:tyrosine-type recombinase/integrase [Eubacterium multiforme]
MQGSVRKRGNTWSYCFDLGKINGKRKRKEKGGFKTKTEAQKALREAINDYEKSGSIVEESNISVSDYLDYWFEEYVMVNCKYNTQQTYKRIIEKHLKPSLGTYKLRLLSPASLQEFINKKFINGFSKSSISNFYGVLSGSLKAAVYPYQFIKENPMKYIKIPKKKNNIIKDDTVKILTLDEFKQIVERFPFESSFYIPLEVAFNTGLRAAEVCGLTWDCIDFDNKTLKVEKILIGKGKGIFEFGTPKTESSNRIIAIGDTLINILKKNKLYQKENKLKYGEFYKDSNFVCTKENGTNITTDSLKYLSRIINYELGIKFNFHMLRHTHATMLLENGANIKDIQLRLGHANLSTTMNTYSHVTEKMKHDTVNILESIIADK